MSRRSLTILASIFALVLTVCAWWQVMLYKVPPPGKLALWLPFIVLLQTSDGVPILIALFQFPVLAVIFVLASRRLPAWAVLAVMLLLYALCWWGALHMLQTHIGLTSRSSRPPGRASAVLDSAFDLAPAAAELGALGDLAHPQ